MVRGTTPTFILKFGNDIDLTLANNVYVTFEQYYTKLNKSGEDIEVTAHQVDVYLSQEETLKFAEGKAKIQVNWTYQDGKRACSDILVVDVGPNLIGSVLQ